MRKLSRKLMNAMIRSKPSSRLSRSILVKNGQIIRPFWLLINSRAARLDNIGRRDRVACYTYCLQGFISFKRRRTGMSDVRYEELDQLSGELLPERMLLSALDLDVIEINLFSSDCY